MVRPRFARSAVLVLFTAALACPRAFAVNKDLIQLQTQVQQLQDAVARLQQSNDERMGVLKDLVQQTADAVNKMSITVNGVQLRMQNQQDAFGAKSDQLSGQIQSLNDSVDELKARLTRMEKALGDIQNNQQSTNAMLGNLPAVTGGSAPAPSPTASGPAAAPAAAPTTPVADAGKLPPPSAGPSAGELYRTAFSDYMAGKNTLATTEFNNLIQTYPDDNLSGNAYFYLGELELRANRPSAAIKSYDHVLEHYPDNSKIPAAHLHKAEALIAEKQTDAGVRELRALITRFPNSPEASQARTRLTALGGSSTTAKRE